MPAPARCADSWQRPRLVPPLPPEAIQVWRLQALVFSALERLERVLSAEEHSRAAAYRIPEDRARFVTTRAALRLLLAHHEGNGVARDVPLCFTALGKPYLAGSRLQFSVSHTQGVAVVALAMDVELGIDIARVNAHDDLAEVARQFFAAEELAALEALPAVERPAAFYRCWTRKEAVLKGLGCGLSRPLNSFAVSLQPEAPARILRASFSGAAEWELAHLDVTADVVGALAWRPNAIAPTIERYDWSAALFEEVQ